MIERVRLQQIRSWTAGEIRFSAGPQILWGANGAGKTTAIEALLVAATGRSHRASALRELVQEGASSGAFTVTLRDPREAQDDPLAATTRRRDRPLRAHPVSRERHLTKERDARREA